MGHLVNLIINLSQGNSFFLLSDKLKRNVRWKYFATSHGNGVLDGTGGAAKARVCEQIRSRGPGAIAVQNSFDFANVSAKLLKNVTVIHISKDDIESAISTMKPWDFVLEAKGVTSCHVAKCSGSIVKIWHSALDTDEEAAITLNYDPPPPVFEGSLPTKTGRFPVASTGIFPSTFVPLVPGVKNSILDSVLKLNPVKRKKTQR